jgi:PPOX class probable F420-dependent enzyme
MPLADAELARLLDRWPVARLATIAAGGRPHLVPIVFARTGGVLWSPIDGKPKSAAKLARVRDIERDPRVTVLLDRYDDDWSRLWWIRVAGGASLVAGDAGAEAALRAKYPQYATTPLFRAAPLLLRIAVETTISWTATPSR